MMTFREFIDLLQEAEEKRKTLSLKNPPASKQSISPPSAVALERHAGGTWVATYLQSHEATAIHEAVKGAFEMDRRPVRQVMTPDIMHVSMYHSATPIPHAFQHRHPPIQTEIESIQETKEGHTVAILKDHPGFGAFDHAMEHDFGGVFKYRRRTIPHHVSLFRHTTLSDEAFNYLEKSLKGAKVTLHSDNIDVQPHKKGNI